MVWSNRQKPGENINIKLCKTIGLFRDLLYYGFEEIVWNKQKNAVAYGWNCWRYCGVKI